MQAKKPANKPITFSLELPHIDGMMIENGMFGALNKGFESK
jgi:hypothetical protein